jgi:hypothetical protein
MAIFAALPWHVKSPDASRQLQTPDTNFSTP